MTKNTKAILIFIGIILLAGIIFYFAILQTQFAGPPGFKSYGESGSAITGLNLISETITTWAGSGIGWGGSSPPSPGESVQYSSLRGTSQLHTQSGGYNERVYSSAFWDIISVKWSPEQTGLTPIGDDFDLTLTTTPGISGTLFYHDLLTKQTFGKGKVFRTEFIIEGSQGTNIIINFFPPTQDILSPKIALSSITLNSLSTQSHLIEIRSSPVTDTVKVYLDGQLINTLQISGDFKLGFSSTGLHLRNSAYKDVFNCQVDPDEQYYYAIFKRPDTSTVSKAQLENFHKWCPDFPVEIYTNAGAIPDETIAPALEGTLDNPPQTFTLPIGQIWGVQYIGEKKLLTTPCELNELLVNGDTCTAKTVLEIDLICQSGGNCAGGETPQGNVSQNDSDGLIITTEATTYVLSSLNTHQFLQNNSKIRFTHYKDDFTSSPSSFNLFGETFVSNIPITSTSNSFSYGTNVGDLAIGNIQTLDNINKVALTRIELQDPISVGVGNTPAFLSEWTFDIDTSFLVLSYDEQTKEIIITNNYYPVDGYFSLIKENNQGQQTSQDIQTSFPLGETRISIGNTTGLVSIAGRPYFNIITPDYNYVVSGSSAITISDLEEEMVIVDIQDESSTQIQIENIQGGDDTITSKQKTKISTGLIVGIVTALIVGTLGYLIFRGLRNPRRRRR